MQPRSKYLVLTAEYLIPFFVIFVAILSYLLAFHTSLLNLKKISCQLDYEPCSNPSLLAELNKFIGVNLLTLDETELKSRLLSGEFTLREVGLSRQFPASLEVTLLSTYPVVAIQAKDNLYQWLTLDERFRIIKVSSVDPNVPTVTVDSVPPAQLGGTLTDPVIKETLTLALEITRELISIKSIYLTSDTTVMLTLSSGLTAILTTTKDQLTQLKTLESLLASPEIVSKYKTIDVRYSQPVLK